MSESPIFGIIAFFLALFVIVYLAQYLWNFVMPDVFGAKQITISQTAALLILSIIFLK